MGKEEEQKLRLNLTLFPQLRGTYSLKEGHVNHLEKMIGSAYHASKTNREQLKSVLNWTLECVRYSDIITIFDIRRETQLDKKILSALLKLQDMTLHQQLYLAMIWDRVDLAEEKIFVHGAETLGKHNYGTQMSPFYSKASRLEKSLFTEEAKSFRACKQLLHWWVLVRRRGERIEVKRHISSSI